MNVLGVERTESWLNVVDGRGHGSREDLIACLDWTIDGSNLRRMVGSDGEDADETTLLYRSSHMDSDRRENLQRLLGHNIPLPRYGAEDTERPNWLRRLFRLTPDPVAFWATAFPDGRVALLYCRCGDLDCRTLSTRVVVHEDSVEWRDIGWQVGYEPFDKADQVGLPANAVFDREAYEELFVDLLGEQWTSRLAEPQT